MFVQTSRAMHGENAESRHFHASVFSDTFTQRKKEPRPAGGTGRGLLVRAPLRLSGQCPGRLLDHLNGAARVQDFVLTMPAFTGNKRANTQRVQSFPGKANLLRDNFGQSCANGGNRRTPVGVSFFGTRAAKMRSSNRFPHHRCCGDLKMTLSVAHISPIISLVAGVLILLMPRLLNLIIALFLILNGLIGLGLLRWLHM
jgi:Protein of unknown function (DUF3096)